MTPFLFKASRKIGIPPRPWMHPNPFKVYEFFRVMEGARLEREHTALDLGCGKGHWTLEIARRCEEVIGVDVSKSMVGTAQQFSRNSPLRHRVRFIHGRLEEAGLPEASLDRLFSFCVLEHIPNLPEVLREVSCLLKPGGEMHVSVDSLGTIEDSQVLQKHRQDHSVVQYFTPETLRAQLEEAGLTVLSIEPILTGSTARNEFLKRINSSYKPNLLHHIQVYRQFRAEDEYHQDKGIMLIARACKE